MSIFDEIDLTNLWNNPKVLDALVGSNLDPMSIVQQAMSFDPQGFNGMLQSAQQGIQQFPDVSQIPGGASTPFGSYEGAVSPADLRQPMDTSGGMANALYGASSAPGISFDPTSKQPIPNGTFQAPIGSVGVDSNPGVMLPPDAANYIPSPKGSPGIDTQKVLAALGSFVDKTKQQQQQARPPVMSAPGASGGARWSPFQSGSLKSGRGDPRQGLWQYLLMGGR